jgi:hypothetical protein
MKSPENQRTIEVTQRHWNSTAAMIVITNLVFDYGLGGQGTSGCGKSLEVFKSSAMKITSLFRMIVFEVLIFVNS